MVSIEEVSNSGFARALTLTLKKAMKSAYETGSYQVDPCTGDQLFVPPLTVEYKPLFDALNAKEKT